MGNYYNKKVEEKVIKNISEFSDYKEIAKFEKPRSPRTLVFLTNDPDEWFIDIIYYKTKSGIVTTEEYIIAKDLPDWIRWKEGLGWKKV